MASHLVHMCPIPRPSGLCRQRLLQVPLNYNKPHGEEAIIPLVKIPAQHNSSDGSYKGMLLTNPGGFGLSGVDFIRDAGDIVLAAVGTNWDIVGFDVRGVGSSVPLADCGNSTSTTTSLDISLRSVPRLSGEFHQARIDAGIELGERCQQKMGGEKDAGPHMSSAIIARDQLHIVEAYARTCEARRAPDEGKLLNYFSMSYGTFAGQTFATLFPDRVGLMLMDAVYGLMTPESDTTFVERAIADVDGAIATFFVYCHLAGPEKCKYATGSRPLDTFNRFKKSYAQLDSSQAGLGVPADILEQSLVAFKLLLFNCLYTPVTTFPVLDNALVALEEALAAGTLLDWIEAVNEPVSGGVGVEDIFNSVFPLAMSCPEMKNEWFGKPLSEFKPTMERISKMSIIGDLLPAIQLLGCAGWSIDSVEIFQGPYGGNTKTPILFSSNSYDPVTPKSK